MFEIIVHMKAKAWVPTSFDRGFANRAKSWIQLRTNTVHYHFAFLSPGSCFKSTICIQLESAPISDRLVFAAVEGWQNYSPVVRKIWGLRWPWSSIQKPPKHRFMFFPSMLSAKEVILRSRNETKGLKVFGFSQQRNILPEEAHWLATTITNCPRAEQILLNRLAKSIMYCVVTIYITLHDITWHYMTLHDITWHYMTLHDITWHYMTLHDITWHYMTLHDITWHDMTWHDMTWHDMTLHDMTWHDMTWHYMTWHDITWHYMTLHYITWHYITLHDITLHYITLHYITLLYTFERFWDFFRVYISSRGSIICRLVRPSGLPEGLTRWQ